MDIIKVNGEDVQLRVFLPAGIPSESRPAVLMVCGLLWFGGGLLGHIGLVFNDSFGYAFAKAGLPCVQVHTPSRHLARTRFSEVILVLLWALSSGLPCLRTLVILGHVLFLAINLEDLVPLLLLLLWGKVSDFSIWLLPCVHLLTRAIQWLRGTIPGPPRRDHQAEIAATVMWMREKSKFLASNGDLVLCGYSSGGHCASLFGVSTEAPNFEAVVLISGIYGLQTDRWSGFRCLLAPLFNTIFEDILGLTTPEAREQHSPEAVVKRDLQGQSWYVLSAKKELMGMQPFEDILFSTQGLCQALTAKGAEVKRIDCGLNHWLLAMSFGDFVGPFCKDLIDRAASKSIADRDLSKQPLEATKASVGCCFGR